VQSDLKALEQAAARGKWDLWTAVPPTFFGPLWRDGSPAGWPDTEPNLSNEYQLLVAARLRHYCLKIDKVQRVDEHLIIGLLDQLKQAHPGQPASLAEIVTDVRIRCHVTNELVRIRDFLIRFL